MTPYHVPCQEKMYHRIPCIKAGLYHRYSYIEISQERHSRGSILFQAGAGGTTSYRLKLFAISPKIVFKEIFPFPILTVMNL